MKFEDLALSRYRFCARKTLKNNETALWSQFEDLLAETVAEIGGLENTFQKTIERKPAKPGYFVPVLISRNSAGKDIVFFDEFHRMLVAGVFLDAFVLHQWIGIDGKFISRAKVSKAAETLREKFFQYAKIESELPAECLVFFTETSETVTGAEEIFSELLVSDAPATVDLGYALVAFEFTGEKALAAIISKNAAEPEAKIKATKLNDVLLREYFLSFAKVDFETNNIKVLKAETARQNLIGYLDWLEKNQPQTLRQIENANRDLTRYRVKLAEKIKAMEIHLHTIEINVGNAAKILENPLLRHKCDELRQILINPLTLRAEQVRSDLTYLRIDEEKAKIVGEEIANLSNLQAGVYGRKLAWLFGLLALIGALQLFPNFQTWRGEVKIAILAAVVISLILIMFGREVKHGIFSFADDKRFQPVENETFSKPKK